MKYIITIFLGCLIALMAGMVPLTPAFRMVAREVMRERMQTPESFAASDIVLIKASDVRTWERAGKEFRLDGRLYDVLEQTEQDGQQYYRCVTDETELSAEASADEAGRAAAGRSGPSPRQRMSKAIADWLAGLFASQQEPLKFAKACDPSHPAGFLRERNWVMPSMAPAQQPPEVA